MRGRTAAWLACFMAGAVLAGCSDEIENPLRASGEDVVAVIDKPPAFPPETLPAGWMHRKFWFRDPMEVSAAHKDGVEAVRCATDASGSIFGRHTDIALDQYPRLAWRWYVETPIDSAVDERTKEGDDHPARLFIRFTDEAGGDHAMEIIWANRLFAPGEYKYIDGFAHYVANGHAENVGLWHDQEVDLLDIYRTITKRTDVPRVSLIAIFCDSDDTGGKSLAYFADVRLIKAGGG